MKYIWVQDINHLKELIHKDMNYFFIRVDYALDFSMDIYPSENNRFLVIWNYNHSEEEFSEEDLLDKYSNDIGDALAYGNLYCYDFRDSPGKNLTTKN